ncbi:TonB-dependent receptor [Dysgonomonas sp. OttesenSCG-928-M03]|nr:TonB-dependent receptor [Dysgonomonas sp. OttesenSCG-928-M03]
MREFISLIFLLCTSICFSQEEYLIRGSVSTSDGSSSTSYVINTTSVESFSPKEVKLQFKEKDFSFKINFMPVLMEVSAEGYRDTMFIINSADEKIDINLRRSQVNLSEVVVKHIIPSFVNERERMEVQVSNTALSESGSVVDVLQKAPKIKVDDNYGIFVGIDEATIYLNGRQISDRKILSMLSSRDIEKIEIVTNPSAKYDSNARVIIDIISKTENNIDGWETSLTGHMTKGKYWKEYAQAEIKGGNSKFSVYGSYTYAPEKMLYHESYGREIAYPPYDFYVLSDIDTKFRTRSSNNIRLGGEYKITKNHSMGLESGLQLYKGKKDANNHTSLYLSQNRDEPLGEVSSSSTNNYDRKNLTSSVFHLYKNESGYWQKTVIDMSDYTYWSDAEASYGSINNKAENDLFAIRTDLSTLLAGWLKLDAGAKYQYRHNRNDNNISNHQTVFYSKQYRYSDKSAAAYALFSTQVDNLTITAGGRTEYIRNKVDIHSTDTNEKLFSRNECEWNFAPNLIVNYKIDDNISLNASYTQSIYRPTFDDLNPAINYIDTTFYSTGNPSLKNERRHNFQLRADYKKMSLGLNYIRRNDAVVWLMEQDENYPTTTKSTQKNISRASIYSLDAVIPLQFNSFNIFLATGVIHSQAEDKKTDLSLNQTLWYGTLNMDFSLPLGIKLNSNHRYFTKGLMNVFYFKPSYRMDMSLKKSFLKDSFTAVFIWNDIFRTDKMKTYTTMNEKDVAYNYSYDQSMVSLSLTYKFNFQQ